MSKTRDLVAARKGVPMRQAKQASRAGRGGY
jgi:hypothetical protein